ncbi:MAG: hypothetical protein K9K21_06215 [Desulfotignum sp.]|nr:hypothetical protein [Desulfotignum sp.]
MKWLFFVLITLFLIVLQTIIFPCFSWVSHSFDLMIMLVLFLSLNFSHYAVAVALAVVGGVMDSLSGGPFFLYMFSYIWIFLIVQFVKQLVFQTSTLFVVGVSLLSIIIQQVLILFSVFIRQGQIDAWQMNLTLMIQQVVWGTVMVPAGVWAISLLYRNWQYMGKKVVNTWEKKIRE